MSISTAPYKLGIITCFKGFQSFHKLLYELAYHLLISSIVFTSCCNSSLNSDMSLYVITFNLIRRTISPIVFLPVHQFFLKQFPIFFTYIHSINPLFFSYVTIMCSLLIAPYLITLQSKLLPLSLQSSQMDNFLLRHSRLLLPSNSQPS